MLTQLDLADLERLYSTLSAIEREELLQALLVAASKGEHEVTRMLEAYCLACAGAELIADFTGFAAGANPIATKSKRSLNKD